MLWWQNLPFFSIMLCLVSAAVCSTLPWRAARTLSFSSLALCLSASITLLFFFRSTNAPSFTFLMGHFPAPWGNEIRAGQLEAFLAILFPLVMLCALAAGGSDPILLAHKNRVRLFYVLCLLLMAALLSQIYSNDLFTCYVFLEIMTLTSCGLLVAKDSGKALAAGMRYMVLNLVGSGLFLLGVVLLYDLTGHLLMVPLNVQVQNLFLSGAHHRSLTMILTLITVGLSIKSALFPFHSWVPDAYSSGFPASNAILSSLVSKGYIILLLKTYVRIFGWDLIASSRVNHMLLLFASLGMIIGSLAAWRTNSLTRMVAWSSVSQIGYIYLGIALGSAQGYQAALFHLTVHSLSKSLLFLSSSVLSSAAGSEKLSHLQGAARKHRLAGICWSVGACSIVGLPFTGGLISKLLLGKAALIHSAPVAAAVLILLALSTFLNVLYFLRTALSLWAPSKVPSATVVSFRPAEVFPCAVLAFLVILTFMAASPILSVLSHGLTQF